MRLNLRNYFVVSPVGDSEYGICVSLPDSSRTHDGQVPEYYEAISIARCQSLVAPNECGDMHLSTMTSKDRLRLCRLMLRHIYFC